MQSESFIEILKNYATLILPWIVIGILISYYLEKHLTPKKVKKYLGKFKAGTIVSAIILGMISPLSIMSFLPVAHELISLGANPAILFVFLIAERAYDMQSFFIIGSLFGLKFAVFNVLTIFISLYFATLAIQNHSIRFSVKKKKHHTGFWYRQAKLLLIVIVGIIISGLFRAYIPQDQFQQATGSIIGSIISGITGGFFLYLGPIMANYPIAKAFHDLGMLAPGVFAFLTISPVVNIVIVMLFGGAVGYWTTIKSFFVYGAIALLITFLITPFLL